MKYIYKGSPVELEPGTVYADFAEKVAADYPAPVILAKVGQRLIELNKTVPEESGTGHCPAAGSPRWQFLKSSESE